MILKQYSILLSILTSGLLVNGQNREWSLQECIDYGVEKSLSMQQRELQNKNTATRYHYEDMILRINTALGIK